LDAKNHGLNTQKDKWTVNLSDTHLSPDQISVLQLGLNFAIATPSPLLHSILASVQQSIFGKLPKHQSD